MSKTENGKKKQVQSFLKMLGKLKSEQSSDIQPHPPGDVAEPDILDRLSKTADDIKNKVSESLPQPEQAQAIVDFVDHRIRQLGEMLRSEMSQTGEQLRLEMEKLYEQQREEMRRQAIYQWIISAALVVALTAKWLMRINHL